MNTDAFQKFSTKYGLDSEIASTGSLISSLIGGWYLNHFSLGRSTWVANDSQKEATISELGIKLKYDCVKSFMDTDAFQKFSTKYGLDYEIVASFCESFATHVDPLRRSGLNITHLLKKKLKDQ